MTAEPDGTDGWTPEFAGQRPPFEEGNELASGDPLAELARITGIPLAGPQDGAG